MAGKDPVPDPLDDWEEGSAFGVSEDKDPVCPTPVEEWVLDLAFGADARRRRRHDRRAVRAQERRPHVRRDHRLPAETGCKRAPLSLSSRQTSAVGAQGFR